MMLRLERVSKFYSAGGLVSTGFSKVDLEFHMGEFVAITGESGSGKSTLLNVISGLDSFEEGEMYIMGQPTSGFSKEDLEAYRKKYIGNIFQTFHLINSYTVYQNVELVLLMSGYEKAVIAEKVSSIVEKVGLTPYLHTKASKLSGGQKQRLCIARALLKKPKILILDDSTSAVDTATEAKIRESFGSTLKNTTKIIIAQRISSVMEADRILVLDEGKIVGNGSHEQLLKVCEQYQEIYYSQMDKEVSAS